MRRRLIVTGAVLGLALAAAPAGGAPAQRNAKPKVVAADVVVDAGRAARLRIVGRDRDDVVRGADVDWGEGQAAFGTSSCDRSSGAATKRRRGKKARFRLAYTYPAPGVYTVSVRVTSGGCGKRRQQHSAPRTLTVHVG